MTRDDPSEKLSFVRPADLPGVEILTAHGSLQPWHVFNERHSLCACRTAAAGWRYRSGTYFVNDRSTMLLEPGEFHRNTTVHRRSDFKVLFLASDVFMNATKEMGLSGTPHFRCAQSEDRRLYDAVYRFSAAVDQGATLLERQSWLCLCIRLLLTNAERQPKVLRTANAAPAIRRATAYLQENFARQVSLDELSAVAALSRFHLVRSFNRTIGIPPHAYQTHVRIERARALLQAGMPPSMTAATVGFADQSHFTRHFKHVMRVTPARYARATA